MDKLRGITCFVHSVNAGGFSAAAKKLLVTPAAVSKAVALLERELGVELLHRTTRHVSLTAEGAQYYDHCRALLGSLSELESGLAGSRSRPRGKLTIGMPPMIARYCIMPALPTLLASYPELEVRATTIFQSSDMLLEGLDVFFCVGQMVDSQLVARKVAQTRMVVCASPDYLARAGVPRVPADLARHDCLIYLRAGRLLDHWRFEKDGQEQLVSAKSVVIGDDRDGLIAAAVAGAGVLRAPDLFIRSFLTSRQLTPILTDWHGLGSPPIYVVYRKSQRRYPKVQVFVDWSVGVFNKLRKKMTS
jgi:LysR family transcriptional regulator for bpeEF and oprC